MGRRKWMLLLCSLITAGILGGYYTANWQTAENEPVAVTAPFQPQYTCNVRPQSSVDLTANIIGLREFQKQYDTTGKGKKIALIDSGIDLGHAAFQKNRTGTFKVAAYRDYTEEGKIKTRVAPVSQGTVTIDKMVYQIGLIPNDMAQYRIAFLDLQDIVPRIQPVEKRKIAVLVTAKNSSYYNCVYVDSNCNLDFRDEQPLYSYVESGQYITLPENIYHLNLALTSISSDGRELQLTTDTLGHGTFLAGLMAGKCDAYQGLAPEAQLYVYKIFNRDGQSSQQSLAQAVYQAVQDKVDCINLSLSISKDEAISKEVREALSRAEEANIPVVTAAGNQGPGKNTVTWPAREPSVIAVGSYGTKKQYLLDRGIQVQKDFIADYSGRGSLGGNEGPFLVASAGMVSAVPGWYSEEYLYDYGTSVSSAITAAVICHVQEALEKQNMILSIEQMKNLLAGWAVDLGYSSAEQGYGALQIKHLPKSSEQIKAREGKKIETIIYNQTDMLTWNFSVPQGQSKSWFVDVPAGIGELEAIVQLDQQIPQNSLEHRIAMGRCYVSIYNPDGILMDQSLYFGASYRDEFCISARVGAILPQPGIWEIVITSADNLSQYNHLESTGTLKLEIQ